MFRVKPFAMYPFVETEYASNPSALRTNPTITAVGAAGSGVSNVTT